MLTDRLKEIKHTKVANEPIFWRQCTSRNELVILHTNPVVLILARPCKAKGICW